MGSDFGFVPSRESQHALDEHLGAVAELLADVSSWLDMLQHASEDDFEQLQRSRFEHEQIAGKPLPNRPRFRGLSEISEEIAQAKARYDVLSRQLSERDMLLRNDAGGGDHASSAREVSEAIVALHDQVSALTLPAVDEQPDVEPDDLPEH